MEKEKPDNIRRATPLDFPYIEQCLIDEGFAIDRHSFKTDFVFITDTGFFSWCFLGAIPRLRHFYVNKESRARWKTVAGLRHKFEKIISDIGYERYVAEVPYEKPELEAYMKRLGASQPYAEGNGDKFYIINIGVKKHENLHANSN